MESHPECEVCSKGKSVRDAAARAAEARRIRRIEESNKLHDGIKADYGLTEDQSYDIYDRYREFYENW
jgi:arginyl-tRNA--protein-N-Asp/Glu arginylyltransferase